MASRVQCVACVLAILALPTRVGAQEDAAPSANGKIYGALYDATGQHVLEVGQVVVFLLDNATGMPLAPDTREVMTFAAAEKLAAFDGYWHAVTNPRGGFMFEDVPPGEYRLIAQSWAGIAGMARAMPKSSRDDPGAEPSSVLLLHGAAEQVVVTAGEKTAVGLKPLGAESLHIVTDPEEPHNFIWISRHAPLRGGIVGPGGWGADFIPGVVGLTRMESATLTIHGLPAGDMVHVALLNYDNMAGVGGASYRIGAEPTVRLPIYASWSNGKYNPPADLLPLVEYLEANNLRGRSQVEFPQDMDRTDYLPWMWQHAEDMIAIDGFGEVRLIDLAAADAHVSLRRSHQRRLERLKARAPSPP